MNKHLTYAINRKLTSADISILIRIRKIIKQDDTYDKNM